MSKDSLRLEDLDQSAKVKDKETYETELKLLQQQMQSYQRAIYQQKKRVILAFEGCDAAGKGGAIRRLTEKLDPRGFVVHPIGPPSPDEHGRHYLYRFWRRLPAPGHIAIFDRTWYGRVLVEKVEELIPKATVKRAYDEINEFERQLTDDGVLIVKQYLHISDEEQLERFAARLQDRHKRWKISADDVRNRKNYGAYVDAANKLLEKTSEKHARWQLVAGHYKWHARLEVLRNVVDALKHHVDLEAPKEDLERVTQIAIELGLNKILPLKVD